MSTNAWLDGLRFAKPQTAERVEARFRDNGYRDLGVDFAEMEPADGTEATEDFRLWMHYLNRVVFMNTGLGVYTHEDRLWRDAFDDGLSPAEAYVHLLHPQLVNA